MDDDARHKAPRAFAAPGTRVPDRAESLLAAGDLRGASRAMVEDYEDIVFACCLRLVRERALAEDLAQQVFLEAHRDLANFRGQSALRTWVITIAANRCKDALKAGRRRRMKTEPDAAVVDTLPDPGRGPSDALDQARLVEALEDCLHELSDDTRATVLLRFQTGMTYDELAQSLDAKADTLCARVARALPALKACLERKGWRRG